MNQVFYLNSIGLFKKIFIKDSQFILQIEVFHHSKLNDVYLYVPKEELLLSLLSMRLLKMTEEGRRIIITFKGEVYRKMGKPVFSSLNTSHFDESLVNDVGKLETLVSCYVDGDYFDISQHL